MSIPALRNLTKSSLLRRASPRHAYHFSPGIGSFPSLLSMKDVDSRLRDATVETATFKTSSLTWHHTTSSLASNDRNEDAHSCQIIQKLGNDANKGDLLFYAVF